MTTRSKRGFAFVVAYHWLLTFTLLVTGITLIDSNESLPRFVSYLVFMAGIWGIICGCLIHLRSRFGLWTAQYTHRSLAIVFALVGIGGLAVAAFVFLDSLRDPGSYSGWGGLALVAAGAIAIVGAVCAALTLGSRWAMRRFAAADLEAKAAHREQ